MGKIFVIEGTDGCGKETQSKLLLESLLSKGYNVKRQSFPNYESQSSGPVKMYLNKELGENAKDIDAYQASVLFAVDRLCTMLAGFKNFLKDENAVLILDRYVESNLIHQAGKIKNLTERRKFAYWITNLEFNILKLPKPDMVLFLDMPPEISMTLAKKRSALKSGTKQDIHEEDPQHIFDAYEAGTQIAKNFGWNVINCVKDGNAKTIEEIHEEIEKSVIECMNQKKDAKFKKKSIHKDELTK